MNFTSKTLKNSLNCIVIILTVLIFPSNSLKLGDDDPLATPVLAPPIPLATIETVSNSLSEPECTKVYSFLVVRNTANRLHAQINMSSINLYANFLETTHIKEMNSFNCFQALAYWDTELVGQFSKDRIDRKDFAETLLEVSLNHIDREDLNLVVRQLRRRRHHSDLMKLEQEIASHSDPNWYGNVSRGSNLLNGRTDQAAVNFYFLMFSIIGFIFLITFCFIVKSYSKTATLKQTSIRGTGKSSAETSSFKMSKDLEKEDRKRIKNKNRRIKRKHKGKVEEIKDMSSEEELLLIDA